MPENFTYFFRAASPFSQWHPAEFEVNGRRYCCMEQYMMAVKARLFGDAGHEAGIMATRDPAIHKRLGRAVEGFDEARWKAAAPKILAVGNRAKFTQNPELLKRLLATAGTTLVEASPYDRIYGIGLEATDPRAGDRATWNGRNLLGQILTDLRDELLGSDQR